MPVVEGTIYFDTEKLIEGKTAKLTYKGVLAQNGAEDIYIHYGFGLLWENLQEVQLQKVAENTFEAEISCTTCDNLNFCFRDGNNHWDNNEAQNYSVPVSKEEITIAKVEPTSMEVPRLKKSYILAKKVRIAFYKVVTFIPKMIQGTWKKKKTAPSSAE